jgi:RecA-family ATPase
MTAQWSTPHVDDLGPPDADEFAPHLSDGNGHDRPGVQAKPGKPRFELVPFNELRPGTEPDYLVAGLIPRVGIVVIWGPPKCGKSFWTFDLTMDVAFGWPYRGRRVEAGTVVYCAFEGAAGFKKRAEAFRRHHELEAEPAFYLLAARADLAKDHAALIADIRAQLGDTRPTAIVLDTLNRSLNGSESKDEDMAKYIRGADAIREAFDCAVLIVHHCGVNDTRPRGHTSLTGPLMRNSPSLATARTTS